jgi:hypothetical protein
LYTGRGPVCGMIIRGSGAVGRVAIGIPGRTVVADGGAACTGAGGSEGLGVAGVAATGTWGGAATGGVGTDGGGVGCGTVNVGRAAWLGVINRGAGGGADGGFGSELDGVAAGGAGAAATGLVSTGGVTVVGRGGAGGGAEAEGCCLLIIAFRTSPGLDMLERSILVLISSGSKRLGRAALLDTEASLVERKCARTLSASWSSRELEWVFFSVTPTTGSESRIALLLTSSSLARSLIRILLIRPFLPPDCPAKSS